MTRSVIFEDAVCEDQAYDNVQYGLHQIEIQAPAPTLSLPILARDEIHSPPSKRRRLEIADSDEEEEEDDLGLGDDLQWLEEDDASLVPETSADAEHLNQPDK